MEIHATHQFIQAVQDWLEMSVQIAAWSRFKAESFGTSTFTGHCCIMRCFSPTTAVPMLQIFLKAIQLFLQNRSQDVGAVVFDKDDDLAVEFVTAAANLRSIAYNIPTQSLFAAKV